MALSSEEKIAEWEKQVQEYAALAERIANPDDPLGTTYRELVQRYQDLIAHERRTMPRRAGPE